MKRFILIGLLLIGALALGSVADAAVILVPSGLGGGINFNWSL